MFVTSLFFFCVVFLGSRKNESLTNFAGASEKYAAQQQQL